MHIAADVLDTQVGPRVQQLRGAAHAARPHHGAVRQGGVGIVALRDFEVRAQDQRIPRVLALQHAGQHDAGRQLGLEVLQAMHREIDAAVQQGLMDFFAEQALAADVGQALARALRRVAGGADRVFLEDVHAAQHRAELAEQRQEGPRLHERQRRGAGADTKRQPVMVRLDLGDDPRTGSGCGAGAQAGLRWLAWQGSVHIVDQKVHRHSPTPIKPLMNFGALLIWAPWRRLMVMQTVR